ncbi:hypothetical protein [Flavobacterium capsici]|uniref:SH3 domain-containing protein n=1 Tax=Flavobacterium capsici TaxID=3075618 RepID=A0AA96F4I9_9FLAO|nr:MULTISPECIES: hypothetical protein [unclassified Flavobacterium]WNM18601.1 hypothetical protein RN608_11345 [Flavobacterium sp. PMR2A8]WNM22652.1 hypothetical protein RN605_04645 [Flavobacterium sp. PMTSA4]
MFDNNSFLKSIIKSQELVNNKLDSPFYKQAISISESLNKQINSSTNMFIAGSLSQQISEIDNNVSSILKQLSPLSITTNDLIKHLSYFKSNQEDNNKAILKAISGNSIEAISKYDWKNNFPTYFENYGSIGQRLNELKNWEFKSHKIEMFNENFQNFTSSIGFENNTLPDALNIALEMEIESNSSEEVVSEIIDETNLLLEEIKNINSNSLSNIYDLFDSFIIKIDSLKNSKVLKDFFVTTISNIISTLIATWIIIKVISNDEVKTINNVTNITYETNNINYFENAGEIKIGSIYVSDVSKQLKTQRRNNSKSICEIKAGTKIKVIKKYKTWLWVRVIDGDLEFPYGFIRNENLFNVNK